VNIHSKLHGTVDLGLLSLFILRSHFLFQATSCIGCMHASVYLLLSLFCSHSRDSRISRHWRRRYFHSRYGQLARGSITGIPVFTVQGAGINKVFAHTRVAYRLKTLKISERALKGCVRLLSPVPCTVECTGTRVLAPTQGSKDRKTYSGKTWKGVGG